MVDWVQWRSVGDSRDVQHDWQVADLQHGSQAFGKLVRVHARCSSQTESGGGRRLVCQGTAEVTAKAAKSLTDRNYPARPMATDIGQFAPTT